MFLRRFWSYLPGPHTKQHFTAPCDYFHRVAETLPETLPTHVQRRRLSHHCVDDGGEYSWLTRDSRRVREFIKRENFYCSKEMKAMKAARRTLEAEMAKYVAAFDRTLSPHRQTLGEYTYSVRTGRDGVSTYHRRRGGRAAAAEELVYHPGQLPEAYRGHDLNQHHQQPHHLLSALRVSPDHRLLACLLQRTAAQKAPQKTAQKTAQFACVLIRIGGGHNGSQETIECLPDVFNAEWLSDEALVYTKLVNLQAAQVCLHAIGQNESHDRILYTEEDPRFFVDIGRTSDGRYLTINCNSRTTSEVHLLDRRRPWRQCRPLTFAGRRPGRECYVDCHCPDSHGFFILSNDGATNLQLFKAREAADGQSPAKWEKVVGERSGVKVQDLEVLGSCCVLAEKQQCRPQLTTLTTRAGGPALCSTLKLPESACLLEPVPARGDDTAPSPHYQFWLSSPVMPPTLYSYHTDTGDLQAAGEGGAAEADSRLAQFTCKRLEAISEDGARVPLTVVHRRGLRLEGQSPLLVEGYGAYGQDLDLSFKPERLALLERNVVLAFPHVRGGGELGRGWHLEAVQTKKHKSFQDFEACLRHLHEAGYSNPTQTALYGSSAGGLLVAAVCQRSPALMKAAILSAPFLNVLGAMSDPSLPLTSQEVEEWGDPGQSQEMRDYMGSYCPLANITPSQRYPSMLVTSCFDDHLVPYWMPLQYVAKRRGVMGHCHDNQLLLRVSRSGGHNNSSNYLQQLALEYAFLIQTLKIPMKIE